MRAAYSSVLLTLLNSEPLSPVKAMGLKALYLAKEYYDDDVVCSSSLR